MKTSPSHRKLGLSQRLRTQVKAGQVKNHTIGWGKPPYHVYMYVSDHTGEIA